MLSLSRTSVVTSLPVTKLTTSRALYYSLQNLNNTDFEIPFLPFANSAFEGPIAFAVSGVRLGEETSCYQSSQCETSDAVFFDVPSRAITRT